MRTPQLIAALLGCAVIGASIGTRIRAEPTIPTTPDPTAGYALRTEILTPAQVAAAAPVQSVNGQTGAVTMPLFFKQLSGTLATAADGTVQFKFPKAFNYTPTCNLDVVTVPAGSNVTYDFPVFVSRDTTQITYKVTARPNALALLTTPLVQAAPSGTQVQISCLSLV